MKKLLYLLSCCVLIAGLYSCEKDDMTNLDEEIKSEAPTTNKRRDCGSHAHMEKLLENPEYQKKHEMKFARLKKFENHAAANRSLCDNPPTIPVAVHYQGITNPDAACLIELAKNQIQILNDDINGTNADITEWTNGASSSFPGIAYGETCINFCLASKNHPSGFNLSDGDLAVTINQTTGDQNGQWSGYLNIFVQFGTGVLGYAPLGGSGNGDGVVIEASAFGAGSGCGSVSPNAPYNLGRTTTHEVGHYLLLDHIWGGGCNQDDDVADTPESASPYYDCPNVGASSCSSTDLHMNYMDYTNDACMYMFSNGQATRMENYISSSLSILTNNAANVCGESTGGGGGGTTPTDTDNDGIADAQDNCPTVANPGQADSDNDGIGDACDTTTPTGQCTTPDFAEATNISETTATIVWGESADASGYQLRYRIKGTSTWTKKNTTQTSLAINNLQPSTTYQFRVRARCPEGWTKQTSMQEFETADNNTGGGGSGSSDCLELTLDLTLDDYGSETTWVIEDEQGNVVESGGPYQDGQNGTQVSSTVCLPDGCYYLILEDAYGDGICCDYGEGSLEVSADGQFAFAVDGYFGYYTETSFCIEGPSTNSVKMKRDHKASKPLKKQFHN